MENKEPSLLSALPVGGRAPNALISLWSEVAELMATLDVIGSEGASALIKIDGARTDSRYTIVLSGGPLGEFFFRKDGGDIKELLREAIEFYAYKVCEKHF